MTLENIQAINAGDIPCDDNEILDECLGLELALHYSTSISRIEDDGSKFSEWLKTQGFVFDKDDDGEKWGWLGAWGT